MNAPLEKELERLITRFHIRCSDFEGPRILKVPTAPEDCPPGESLWQSDDGLYHYVSRDTARGTLIKQIDSENVDDVLYPIARHEALGLYLGDRGAGDGARDERERMYSYIGKVLSGLGPRYAQLFERDVRRFYRENPPGA